MKVIVLIQPGDSLNKAELFKKDIEDMLPGEVFVELAVETNAEDPETRLGSYEPVQRN